MESISQHPNPDELSFTRALPVKNRERIMLRLEGLVAEGVDSPEKVANWISQTYGKKGIPYSAAIWDTIRLVDPENPALDILGKKVDWKALYAPAVVEPAEEPTREQSGLASRLSSMPDQWLYLALFGGLALVSLVFGILNSESGLLHQITSVLVGYVKELLQPLSTIGARMVIAATPGFLCWHAAGSSHSKLRAIPGWPVGFAIYLLAVWAFGCLGALGSQNVLAWPAALILAVVSFEIWRRGVDPPNPDRSPPRFLVMFFIGIIILWIFKGEPSRESQYLLNLFNPSLWQRIELFASIAIIPPSIAWLIALCFPPTKRQAAGWISLAIVIFPFIIAIAKSPPF